MMRLPALRMARMMEYVGIYSPYGMTGLPGSFTAGEAVNF